MHHEHFSHRLLTLYDAGLYHVSAIRWANSYPVVPGLGNLYGPLASNSSFFLYLAMVNTGPLDGQGHHIGVGLLMVTLFAQMGISAWRVIRRSADAPASPVDYFLALLIAPALVVSAWGFSNTATDYPVFILPILVSAQLLTLLWEDTAGRREALFIVFFITLIASAAVTMKLSLAVFGLLSVLTALAVVAVRYRSNQAYLAAALLVAVVTASLLLFPWLARGVVLSGYPLYPSTFAPAPVEWRVPEAAMRREMDYVIGLARRSDSNYVESAGSWDWVGPWFVLRWLEFFPPLVIGLAAPIAAWLSGRREAGLPRAAWLSLLPCWLAIVGWFFTVPWPRYISSLFWIAGAGAVALVLPSLRLPARSLLTALLCAVAVIPSFPGLTLLIRVPVAIVRGRWAGVDDMPKVPLNVFTTSSGLEVNIPANAEDLPWDAPLPSAPRAPDTDPRLRCPGSLRRGFIADQSPQ
jgi:hypothetical protein